MIISKDQMFYELRKPDELNHPKIECTQDLIEIKKISPEGIFHTNGNNYSQCYQIENRNYEALSYEEQVEFVKDWHDFISSFDTPIKLTVANIKRSMKEVNEKILYQLKDDGYDNIREAYNDQILKKIVTEKNGIEQRMYLTVNKSADSFNDSKRYFEKINLVNNAERKGFGIRELSATERLYPLYKFYRGGEDRFDFTFEESLKHHTDWRNEIAPDYIRFQKDKFYINENYVGRSLYIEPSSYGSSYEDDLLYRMCDIPITSMISVDYINIPKELFKAALDRKYMAIEGKVSSQKEKRRKQKDYLGELTHGVQAAKDNIKELLDEAQEGETKMLWVGVTVCLLAESEEELDKITNDLIKICADNSCVLKTCINRQREGMNTSLPIGVRNHGFMRAMFSRMASGFIPFYVCEAIQSKAPIYYGANKQSKNPILQNRKLLINPNGFVFGKPGSGKSFTGAKMEIGSVFVSTNDDIIIIDPQNEFADTVQLYNGTTINLDDNAKTYVNPLDINLEELDNVKGLENIIKEKNSLMYSIVSQCLEGEDTSAVGLILSRCVRKMYKDIAAKPKGEREVPIMSTLFPYVEKEVARERQNNNEIKAYAAELLSIAVEKMTEGSFSIFDHQTNVNPKNRIVSYGMRDIDKEIWGVAITVMIEAIKKRVMYNFMHGKATRIYIDEFHYITKTQYSCEYVIEAYKTYRKFGGIVTGLTQNVSDLLKSDDMVTLISNSEYTLFMAQAPTDIDKIINKFKGIVTSEQLKYVRNAAPGTGLIRFGNAVIPLDNVMENDAPLYNVYSTNMYEKTEKEDA